jgi:glycosyltransferase involved in cell wall biosynthesis
MHVGVHARELVGRRTGVGRYLSELLARWTRAAWAAGDRLTLYLPEPVGEAAGWLGRGGASWEAAVLPGGRGTLWEQIALARAVRRDRPDVLFAPGYTAPILAGCPVVVAMHDVSFAAHPEWFRWREGLRLRVLARLAARRARAIVTISRFSRAEIVRCLRVPADRIEVIPLAVDTHPSIGAGPEPPASGCREPLVLYVGSIFTRRHVPVLVRAFARAAAGRPGLRLEIVGENRTHPHEDLVAVARDAGVADRVRLRGWVPDAELARLYGCARAFAFLAEYEGFGLTPLEAMRAGVPAVVADTPVAREVYLDAPLYVDPRDEAAVAAALARALDEGGDRHAHIEAGRRVAARYSWADTADRTFRVLRRAAGGSV